MPASVAAIAACSIASPADAPQLASSAPQEIEHTSQPSAVAAHGRRDVLRPVDADIRRLAGGHGVSRAGDLDVERDLAVGVVAWMPDCWSCRRPRHR